MRTKWHATAMVLSACALAACGTHRAAQTPSARAFLASPAPSPAAPAREVFGYSAQHRALVDYRVGQRTGPVRLLVVGVIHGDETAGEPVVRQLLKQWQPSGNGALVVVPQLNPDGIVHHTRQNARRVDLNRNFPYAWRQLGKPGDQQYSGTGPLSEPESKAMAALIRRLRPAVTVWFHQPVNVVDLSGGSAAIEQRFARILGEPTKHITDYPGSATRWQNAGFPGTTAFVVELPHAVTTARAAAAVRALLDLRR
ncbi:MAG: murein peptide amidase [Actinomycetota bacterium]|nr:murein peptide amidase [Actinomycetota bacterium]